MAYYDGQLQLLQQQVAQKKRQESKLKELYGQHQELSTRVSQLEKVKLDEQADVDRLEGNSLAAFFYGVVGKRDEKLDNEREEAYAAAVKYDAAAGELSKVEEDIRRCEGELDRLQGCEQQYEKMLKTVSEAVKALGSEQAVAILRTEEAMACIESQKREIQESISAGQTALETIKGVLFSLESAEGWGAWDMLGGGLLTDLAKHSHLDEAQKKIEQLQEELRRFKTELADVTIHMDLQVNIDGFLLFADYFFDGLFADWAVMEQINESQARVQSTKEQIESVLSRLNDMASSADKALENEKIKRDDLIVNASFETKGIY
ncbi:hypothetical protein [Anaerotignum sp. MB30-C6]|uniref:hypothetical protein n=1 Tax=Anaerotignum sp. MB30-C6 TaxID=3070814 RepID=UPI0027DE212B|nr:hypothetical protein [Anaerotignum sp. MB30-C6]WMI81191.1 hypothetical protein RBQ60_00225 [Anaerotignum sp. MB30-C6]